LTKRTATLLFLTTPNQALRISLLQTTSSKIGSILRWLVGLCLPALLLAGGSALALWAEYHTPYAAVRLGDYLLQHNASILPSTSNYKGAPKKPLLGG
jgi:hypothetical protein